VALLQPRDSRFLRRCGELLDENIEDSHIYHGLGLLLGLGLGLGLDVEDNHIPLRWISFPTLVYSRDASSILMILINSSIAAGTFTLLILEIQALPFDEDDTCDECEVRLRHDPISDTAPPGGRAGGWGDAWRPW